MYRDIVAVRYERTNCFGKCPSYQVLFTRASNCYYVGFQYVPKHGTYESRCSPALINRIITTLESHGFYDMNYDSSVIALDVPHYIIAAERCGVTTTLDWPAYGNRADIIALFKDLDTIERHISWHKSSDSIRPPLPLFAPIPVPD